MTHAATHPQPSAERDPGPGGLPAGVARAVVFETPGQLAVRDLALKEPGPGDLVVDVQWSGISTGTERLLWDGRMPSFPGLGYPLVPGYESCGRVVAAAADTTLEPGAWVFVPGSAGFAEVRGLFGGAASRLVVPEARVVTVPETLAEATTLLALAGTARHLVVGGPHPELVVGHGALGRLVARLCVADGHVPVVWETNPQRRDGALGYEVIDPADDARRDYKVICDVSGASSVLPELVARLAPGGELVLGGFYAEDPVLPFVPAFLREARFRIAAEWQRPDLEDVAERVRRGTLPLDGLVTHRRAAHDTVETVREAYTTAFGDPACLKMVLDWNWRSDT